MKFTKMHLVFVLSVIIMYWYIIKQDLKKKIEKSHFKLGGWPSQNPDHKGGTQKKLAQNIGFLYSKWPYRSHGLIKKITSPQTRNWAEIYIKDCKNLAVWFGCGILGGFYQISRPPDKFEGWFFFNKCVWSVWSFWIQKTYILRQFFWGPPLRDPDFDLVTPQA